MGHETRFGSRPACRSQNRFEVPAMSIDTPPSRQMKKEKT